MFGFLSDGHNLTSMKMSTFKKNFIGNGNIAIVTGSNPNTNLQKYVLQNVPRLTKC